MDYIDSNPTMSKKRARVPAPFKWAAAVVAVICCLVLWIASTTTVHDGFSGCLYRFGELKSTDVGKGLKFHKPFIESIEKVDMRQQLYEEVTEAYTSDGQTLENIHYSVIYSYDQDKLEYLIKNVGISNVESRLIAPNAYSFMKNIIGKYKAELLVQNREKCQETIEDALRDYLKQHGIYVSSFNLTNLDFEDSFEEAVRAKVEMEQRAQQAKNETVLRQEEASQKVIAAEADATAAKLSADAEAYAIQVMQEQLAQSPNYIELQKIQKWNGEFPQIMGNSVNPFVTINDGT